VPGQKALECLLISLKWGGNEDIKDSSTIVCGIEKLYHVAIIMESATPTSLTRR